jgi:exopolysaccharide biosynthesis protein
LIFLRRAPSLLVFSFIVVSLRADEAASLGFFQPKMRHGSESIECSLVRFHASEYKLIVIHNGPRRADVTFKSLADAMERLNCVAGTNGGFFDIGTFQPNGLMISQSRSTGQFDRKNWAEGILAVRGGAPILADRDRFELDSSVTELIQTGPWLVRNGVSKSGFTNDETTLPRTFIATDGKGSWLVGHVAGSTLKDLATLLCSPVFDAIMPVQDALNLDGGPSSAFWFRHDSKPAHYIEEGTIVRNFVGIRKK